MVGYSVDLNLLERHLIESGTPDVWDSPKGTRTRSPF